MNQQLEDLLAVYLGELLYKKDNCFDWIEVEKLKEKINAVYVLLGVEKKEKSFMEAIKEIWE